MRFGALFGLVAMTALAGCEPPQDNKSGVDPTLLGATADQTVIGGDFDYRFAFRMPPARIAQLQDAHVRACDQLGASRCRVMTVRYHVGDDNKVSAVLTLMIDPAIARTFASNAAKSVAGAGGLMTDSRMAGGDTSGGEARAGNVVVRLRQEIANIDTQLRGTLSPPQRAAATEKQTRLRAAVETIGEVDPRALQGSATAAMLFTYGTGNALPSLGGSPEASFDAAGETFLSSLAGLTQVLAGVGPWLLVLLGGALLLRRLIPQEEAASPAPAPAPAAHESRNIVQRLFGREEPHDVHEPVN